MVISKSEYTRLPVQVRNQAKSIYKKLQSIQTNIDNALAKAEEAKNAGVWFGAGRKRDILLAEASGMQSEAMRELADIQQATIAFTCKTVDHASQMVRALSYLAVHGIDGVVQRIELVGGEAADAINTIISQAENFVEQQKKIQQEQYVINVEIDENKVAIGEAKSGLQRALDRIKSMAASVDKNGKRIDETDKRLNSIDERISGIDSAINGINRQEDKLSKELGDLNALLKRNISKTITFSMLGIRMKVLLLAPTGISIALFIMFLATR
jgi:chromosome segregation ATPase